MTKPAKPEPNFRMIASDMRMKQSSAKRILEDTATILLGPGNKVSRLSPLTFELDNGGIRLYQIRITNKGFWFLDNQIIIKNKAKGRSRKNKGMFFQYADELEKYLLTLLQKDIAAFIEE